MSDQIPSQAEGERQDDITPPDDPNAPDGHNVARTTPSQAEGEDPDAEDSPEDDGRTDP
ncbi:hypothetical protein OYE22_03135 [Streptomyces sp. 71268]|uniref:hypothetical protein n=1 Tax=Streptomyces sp. 71268 TaxID=3002640 RepID=UPI0023F8A63D|nr:hypothetical protein [Streptomyces sp. 71268]WEV24305.1 hypothetical protein OYE22_03135 [Streptomyces sp. 71268]